MVFPEYAGIDRSISGKSRTTPVCSLSMQGLIVSEFLVTLPELVFPEYAGIDRFRFI